MTWSRSAPVLVLVLLMLGFPVIVAGSTRADPAPDVFEPGGGQFQEAASTPAAEPTAVPQDDDSAVVDDTSDTSGGVLGRGELPEFLIALLAFGFLSLVVLFLYLYMAQQRFYGVFSGLAASGKPPQVTSVAPFAGATQSGTLSEGTREAPPVIKGPGVVTVGTQSEEFAAEQDGKPVTDAQWSVSPATAAAVSPQAGAKVRVIATAPGAFELAASKPGSGVQASVQVAAVSAEDTNGTLPFIGSGFGSIVVTIILVVGVTALAFNNSLGSEAVATFFGGLLGYVFGSSATGGRASRER